MRTPDTYTESLMDGVVTGAMLRDCIYAVNKRAKNWRDRRDKFRDGCWPDIYDDEARAKRKKDMYYEWKSLMLGFLEPKKIQHVVYTDRGFTSHEYLLCYKLGKYWYHRQIEKGDLPRYRHLKVVRTHGFSTCGRKTVDLLSDEFV